VSTNSTTAPLLIISLNSIKRRLMKTNIFVLNTLFFNNLLFGN